MYAILKVRKSNGSIVNVIGYAESLCGAQNVSSDLNACLNPVKSKIYCIIYQQINHLSE